MNGLRLALFLGIFVSFGCTTKKDQSKNDQWKLTFSDSCTGDWQQNWFLDGEIATVENSSEGMNFSAGPINRDDAHHAVLWTKKSFEGDIKIEYNYTRTDDQIVNVNILYIQATGIGTEGFDKDIYKWREFRKVAAMGKYYNYMKTIHISYAAFPMVNEDPENDYIRVRRYPVTDSITFQQMEVPPSFERVNLFLPNVTYKLTWEKVDDNLSLTVEGNGETKEYSWDMSAFESIVEGRIGLRHMYTRSAQYSDFKVYSKD